MAVVNQNITHAFSTQVKAHISMITEPLSLLYFYLKKRIGNKDYLLFDEKEINDLKKAGQIFVYDKDGYDSLIGAIEQCFELSYIQNKLDQRIKETIELVKTCDCDQHSIDVFASQIGLSSSRLSHLFKEEVGMSLKNYIQLHQMKKAYSLLLIEESITEAALSSGFDSPSHFAATSKKMMGMSATFSLKDSEILKV